MIVTVENLATLQMYYWILGLIMAGSQLKVLHQELYKRYGNSLTINQKTIVTLFWMFIATIFWPVVFIFWAGDQLGNLKIKFMNKRNSAKGAKK